MQSKRTLSAKAARKLVREWPQPFVVEDLSNHPELTAIATWYLNKAKRAPHRYLDQLRDGTHRVHPGGYRVVLDVMRERELAKA